MPIHRPCLSDPIAAACTALLIASLAGCGETGPTPSAEPAAAAPAGPQVRSAEGRPSTPSLVELGNAAFRAGRLFDPPRDNAFEHFTAALAQDPEDAAAREALADIFPLALARVEAAMASGDRAEAGRLLDALDASFKDSPALANLRRQLSSTAAPSEARGTPAVPAAPVGLPPPVAVTTPSAVAIPPDAAEPASGASPDSGPPAVSNESSPSTSMSPVTLPESRQRSTVTTPAPQPTIPSPLPNDAPALSVETLPIEAPAVDPSSRDARLVRRVPADYPALARQRRIGGWVDLEYVVGTDGRVVDVRVLDSDPPRVFDISAERALRRWQFEPASRAGIPTQSVGRTRIEFSPG